MVTEEQIREALEYQRVHGGGLGPNLVPLGQIPQEELELADGARAGDVVELDGIELPPEIIERVPARIARQHRIVPVAFEGSVLTVATADPLELDWGALAEALGFEVQLVVSTRDQLAHALSRYYPESEGAESDRPR